MFSSYFDWIWAFKLRVERIKFVFGKKGGVRFCICGHSFQPFFPCSKFSIGHSKMMLAAFSFSWTKKWCQMVAVRRVDPKTSAKFSKRQTFLCLDSEFVAKYHVTLLQIVYILHPTFVSELSETVVAFMLLFFNRKLIVLHHKFQRQLPETFILCKNPLLGVRQPQYIILMWKAENSLFQSPGLIRASGPGSRKR